MYGFFVALNVAAALFAIITVVAFGGAPLLLIMASVNLGAAALCRDWAKSQKVEPPDELAVLRASVEAEPPWMPAVTRARELYMKEQITQDEFLKMVEEAGSKPPPLIVRDETLNRERLRALHRAVREKKYNERPVILEGKGARYEPLTAWERDLIRRKEGYNVSPGTTRNEYARLKAVQEKDARHRKIRKLMEEK